MRTAYLGTSDFAATVLRRLADSPHRPALVVAPPDRRRGRGRGLAPPPVAEAARELGIELHQTADVDEPESVERLRSIDLGAIGVCAFGQIIGEPLVSEELMLNLHPSLLPRWRGAAPIERAILAGDERTGVTVMRISPELDAGPIALREQTAIEPGEGFESLAARLAGLGGELLVRAFDLAERDRLELSAQDEAGVTYAEKIAPHERRLDPSQPADELERRVRALNPHVGTYLELEGGERLAVGKASALETGPAAGELEAREGELLLGCSQGGLRLELVKPPGGREMPAEDFLRGHDAPRRAV